MRGEAKKGRPQMTQIYADESRPSAGDGRQPPQIDPEFFICAHLRHLRTKKIGFAAFTRLHWAVMGVGEQRPPQRRRPT